MPLLLLALLVCLVVSACLEVAETAIVSINVVRLQTLVQSGDRRAALVGVLRKDMRRTLSTLLLGMTLFDIAASAIATIITSRLFGESAVTIEAVGLTIIVLVFVRIIPKSYAIHNPERWACRLAAVSSFLVTVLSPVVAVVNAMVAPFYRRLGKEAPLPVSEDEIKTMARMGVKSGAVEHGEKELIERVFLFNDITAGDVMTPREVMVGLEAGTQLGATLASVNAQRYSRYPVYDGTMDAIVGIVHIKDMLAQVQKPGALETLTLRDIAAPPVYVQEKALIDDLFRELKRQHVHMAVVVNDAKAVVGLVTLEDLLEELVGEISDESDVDEHVIKRIDKHTVLVHGDTDIPDVNRFFNTRIEAGEERTVGRLVRRKAGKVPKQGQPVMVAEGLMAIVEQINRGRILKVRLIKSVNGVLKE
ncbi:MAG TPA: hemolysin family protein [Candidatus Eisenbacteria bacterium]|jgi:CBS domain containing-hemolysin-like protein|nr:hemolysin family protein [Candidatus Eisenbacteria bacterium]